MNPVSEILNPEYEILIPESWILNPSPWILNPSPWTLNPGVDPAQFGSGAAKTTQDLVTEVEQGETTLEVSVRFRG